MRSLLICLLGLATAACASAYSEPESTVTLVTAEVRYSPGEWATPLVRNRTSHAIGFIDCPRPLERWAGDEWVRIALDPPPPDTGRLHLTDICTSVLPVLAPGVETHARVQIPPSAPPGWYRFLFWWVPVEGDTPRKQVPFVSAPFEVRS